MEKPPDCVDPRYAMTAQEHALLHISAEQGKQAYRIDELERLMKAQARRIAKLERKRP